MRRLHGILSCRYEQTCAAFQPLAALLVALVLIAVASPLCAADKELTYNEFQALAIAAHRLDKVAMLEPTGDQVGMYLVLADRFGVVHAYHLTHGDSKEIWKSKHLDGVIHEIQVGDLDNDGYNDMIMARTSSGRIYVWSGATFDLRYESLPTDFVEIHSFTLGNVDEDPVKEIIVNANNKIFFLDGQTFKREWTSINNYTATRMQCGDVDGDNVPEIVLNTGQIVDTFNGDIKWEEEAFFNRIELLDMDGDGIPEILTEGNGTSLKVYDMDHGKEKRL